MDKYEILYGSDLTMSQLIDQINSDASLQTIYEATTPASSHPGLTPNYYATREWSSGSVSSPDFSLFDPDRPPSAGGGDAGGALHFTRREFWGDLNPLITITWESVG